MNSFKLSALAIGTFIAGNAFALDPLQIGPAEVTLYGRVVAGVDYTTNLLESGVAGSRFQVASNQWGTSNWGMRVRMPLKDGWSGVANLESGFGANNGVNNTSGDLFDRAANVGIDGPYGQLTVGNHMWIAGDSYAVDPMENQWIGLNSLTNGRYWGNGNNTVLYRSPTVAGFQVGFMHMAGGVVGNSKRSSGNGISAAYVGHGLDVRVIADEMSDAYGRYSGGSNYGLGSQGAWTFSKSLLVGAAYDIGAFKLYVGHSQITAPDADYGTYATFDKRAKTDWIGAHYRSSDSLTFLGSYFHLSEPQSGKKSNLFALGANYTWNKYLTSYVTFGHVSNNSISAASQSTNGANNHALYSWDSTCNGSGSCDGVGSTGGYAGFALTF